VTSVVTLEVDPTRIARRLALACAIAVVGLAWLDWQIAWGGRNLAGPLRRFCDAAREDGLAAWVATTQAAVIAAVAWACAVLVRRADVSSTRRAAWIAVAVVMTWLALDDGTQLHERLGTMLDDGLRATRRDPQATGALAWLGRYPSYGWQLAVGPPLAAAAVFLLAFLLRELGTPRARRILVAACAAVALAVAMDFIEGLDRDHPWNFYARLAASERLDDWSHRRFDASAFATVLHAGRVLEELIEIAAGTALLALLLRHLVRLAPELRLRASGAAGE
jgi:hypothetical protein